MQKLRAFRLFCRPFAAIFILISITSCYIMWRQHTLGGVFLFLLLKIFSDAAVLYLWHSLRPNQLYLYHNLGFSKRNLYAGVFLADILLFAGLVFITAQLI